MTALQAGVVTKTLMRAGHPRSETIHAHRGVVRSGWSTWTTGCRSEQKKGYVAVYHLINSEARIGQIDANERTVAALEAYAKTLTDAGYKVEMEPNPDHQRPHLRVRLP